MRIGFSRRLTNTKRGWLEDISAHNLRPARVFSEHTAAYSFRASLFSCIATFRTRVSDGIVELQVASGTADHEPDGENLIHRDRPIRWVQRKPSSPISAPSEVL